MSIGAKVYQDNLGWGKGNCAWACVSTILGVPFEDVRLFRPPSDVDLTKWTVLHAPDHDYHYVDRGHNYRLVPGPSVEKHPHPERWEFDVPEDFTPPCDGLWMATVFSPGLKRPEHDPYYPMPALHAVVMRGDKLYHDPNPNYNHDSLYSPVVVMSWWTPRPQIESD